MRELSTVIWHKINGDKPLRFVSDTPYTTTFNGACRRSKRRDACSASRRRPTLAEALDEIIPWDQGANRYRRHLMSIEPMESEVKQSATSRPGEAILHLNPRVWKADVGQNL